jgi:hypothetical protein
MSGAKYQQQENAEEQEMNAALQDARSSAAERDNA